MSVWSRGGVFGAGLVRQNVRRRGSFFFVARELCLPIATEAVFARLRRAWRPGVSVPDFGGPVPDSRGSLFSRGSPFECSGRDRRAYSILLGRDICRARGRTTLEPCPAGSAERIAFCSDATYVAPEEGPLPNPGPVTEVASEEEGHDFRVHSSSDATYVAPEEQRLESRAPAGFVSCACPTTPQERRDRAWGARLPRTRRMSRPRKSGHENRVPLPRRRPLSPGQGLGVVLPRARHMSRPSKMLYAQRTRPDRVREWSFLGRDICRVRAKCYKLGGPAGALCQRENHENREQNHRSQEQEDSDSLSVCGRWGMRVLHWCVLGGYLRARRELSILQAGHRTKQVFPND